MATYCFVLLMLFSIAFLVLVTFSATYCFVLFMLFLILSLVCPAFLIIYFSAVFVLSTTFFATIFPHSMVLLRTNSPHLYDNIHAATATANDFLIVLFPIVTNTSCEF